MKKADPGAAAPHSAAAVGAGRTSCPATARARTERESSLEATRRQHDQGRTATAQLARKAAITFARTARRSPRAPTQDNPWPSDGAVKVDDEVTLNPRRKKQTVVSKDRPLCREARGQEPVCAAGQGQADVAEQRSKSLSRCWINEPTGSCSQEPLGCSTRTMRQQLKRAARACLLCWTRAQEEEEEGGPDRRQTLLWIW